MTLREEGSPPVWIPSDMKGSLVSTGRCSKDHDTNFFLVDVGRIHWPSWILVDLSG